MLKLQIFCLLSIVFLISCTQQEIKTPTPVNEETKNIELDINILTPVPESTVTTTYESTVESLAATKTIQIKPTPTKSIQSTPSPENTPMIDVCLISKGWSNEAANASSEAPAVSSTGEKIAFVSGASNLVKDDDNNLADVFIYDMDLDDIRLVSLANDGTQSNYDNGVIYESGGYINLSSSGDFVAFQSYAQDLVATQSNQLKIFLYQTGGNLRLLYEDTENPSTWPVISEEGKLVAFVSASYQQDTVTNQIFLFNDELDSVINISHSDDGLPANGWSGYSPPAMTDRGRFIAFDSIATNLSDVDHDEVIDVFVHDRQNDTTELVSQSNVGLPANNRSDNPALSAEGRYVVFASLADNLDAGDSNRESDIFLRDTIENKTILISRALNGQAANGASYNPDISSDGKLIVFSSTANNLVGNDLNNAQDVFMFDVENNKIVLVSRTLTGEQANNQSVSPAISGDGSTIVYQSLASNLVNNDTNETWDIFAVNVASLLDLNNR